jgi:hypothetical protein
MELELKTSIIDYLGEKHGGVSILIGLTLSDDFTFESILWIHPTMEAVFEAEADFLKLFGVSVSEELPFLSDIISDIETILPSREEIFSEFL